MEPVGAAVARADKLELPVKNMVWLEHLYCFQTSFVSDVRNPSIIMGTVQLMKNCIVPTVE